MSDAEKNAVVSQAASPGEKLSASTDAKDLRAESKKAEKSTTSESNPKKKKAFAAAVQAIVDLLAPVMDDTLRIVAAFFVVVCFGILMAAILPWSRAVAIIALVLIAAGFLAVIVYVWVRQKLPAKQAQPTVTPAAAPERRWLRTLRAYLMLFFLLLSAAIPVAVDRLELVQKAFPERFPEFAATQGLRSHYAALTDLLRAKTDAATLDAFVRYAETTTGAFQKKFFRGHTNVVQLLADYHAKKAEATQTLLAIAEKFKESYGRIDNLFVEYTTRASWRKIKLGTASEAIFQAVVRYEGRFTYNRYDDPRFTVERLNNILDLSSAESKEFQDWLSSKFDGFSRLSDKEKQTLIRKIPVGDLAKPNLLDLMAYRFPALGPLSDEVFRDGWEISWCSIEMQRESAKGSIWKVSVLAPWGSRRIPFSEPSKP